MATGYNSVAVSAVRTISAATGTTSIVIANDNPDRKGFILYNNSANTRYFTCGTISSAATPTFIVATFTHFIWTAPNIIYTGPISVIANSGTGTVVVTEFV